AGAVMVDASADQGLKIRAARLEARCGTIPATEMPMVARPARTTAPLVSTREKSRVWARKNVITPVAETATPARDPKSVDRPAMLNTGAAAASVMAAACRAGRWVSTFVPFLGPGTVPGTPRARIHLIDAIYEMGYQCV